MTYSAYMIITAEKTAWQTLACWIVFDASLFSILTLFYIRRDGNKKMIVFGDVWNVDNEVRDE